MKSFVRGGAGFIGSHLCEQLLELGNEGIGLPGGIEETVKWFGEQEANI